QPAVRQPPRASLPLRRSSTRGSAGDGHSVLPATSAAYCETVRLSEVRLLRRTDRRRSPHNLRWVGGDRRRRTDDESTETQTRAHQNPQRPYARHPGHWMMRWSRLHGDMQGCHPRSDIRPVKTWPDKTTSEIPCRVSSDLHEWRNDLGAVSTRDPVKL